MAEQAVGVCQIRRLLDSGNLDFLSCLFLDVVEMGRNTW
jgi:hypothetical protein